MGKAAIQIKIMPESPNTNLEEIKKEAESRINALDGKVSKIVEEAIAFGLKAIIITLAWPEEKDTSLVEDSLSKIEHVSSAQITDYRRAFG